MGPPSYCSGLPEPLASRPDAMVLLGTDSFPLHSQIVSLHSPVLAELLAAGPEELGTSPGQPRTVRLQPADEAGEGGEAETPRTAARSYDPRRRPALGPESFAAFLGHCYGQEPDLSNTSALGRLLVVGEQLGCASLPRAVDRRLAWELLSGVHGDLAGAASLATRHRLVTAMGALLPLLSHRRGGGGRGGGGRGGGHGADPWPSWEAAFEHLDGECKRISFALARATAEEREEQGLGDLPAAAAYCAGVLKSSGWGERRGRSPELRMSP